MKQLLLTCLFCVNFLLDRSSVLFLGYSFTSQLFLSCWPFSVLGDLNCPPMYSLLLKYKIVN